MGRASPRASLRAAGSPRVAARELGLRRVSWVRVVVHGRVTTAEVFGIGHRLPVTRRVPLATALDLAARGVPLVVHADRPVAPPRPACVSP